LLIGIIALVVLLLLGTRSVVPSIEKDLIDRVTIVLVEENISNVLISVSGQEITVEGLVSPSEREKVLALINNVSGVTKVHDELNQVVSES